MMITPPKIEAMLPRGCDKFEAPGTWDHIASEDGPPSIETLQASVQQFTSQFYSFCADAMGLEGKQRALHLKRDQGPRFAIKCAAGKPSSGQAKASPTSIAWRLVATWFTSLAAGLSQASPLSMRAASARAAFLLNLTPSSFLAMRPMQVT